MRALYIAIATILHATIYNLRLKEAIHIASLPVQVMTWLGLQFDMVNITVTIPKDKL